jgi:hypothetical protein
MMHLSDFRTDASLIEKVLEKHTEAPIIGGLAADDNQMKTCVVYANNDHLWHMWIPFTWLPNVQLLLSRFLSSLHREQKTNDLNVALKQNLKRITVDQDITRQA